MYTDLQRHFVNASFPDLRDAGTGQRLPTPYWDRGHPGDERKSRRERDRARGTRGRFGRRVGREALYGIRSR
jgi:hypothetical protein